MTTNELEALLLAQGALLRAIALTHPAPGDLAVKFNAVSADTARDLNKKSPDLGREFSQQCKRVGASIPPDTRSSYGR